MKLHLNPLEQEVLLEVNARIDPEDPVHDIPDTPQDAVAYWILETCDNCPDDYAGDQSPEDEFEGLIKYCVVQDLYHAMLRAGVNLWRKLKDVEWPEGSKDLTLLMADRNITFIV